MYARYRTRSRFYKQPERVLKAYNVSPSFLRRPQVKRGLLNGIYTDDSVDLRQKEQLELLEEIRHPKERDFYQDHTYHNQWVDRDLELHQKRQIASRYAYFHPDYAIRPWLWFPGDEVEVVSGSEAVGQRGTILAVVPYKNEIIVQHINVQDIVIPATDTRPEQTVQREHPIHVDRVRHVDPSTGQTCTLAMVKVFKKGTRELEERRISLESGVLLPIPERQDAAGLETGDPLRDTPIQDAEEETVDAKTEQALLVDRKLKAMEEYFTNKVLRPSYEFHQPLRRANAAAMQRFQVDVVEQATSLLSNILAKKFMGQLSASAHRRTSERILSAAETKQDSTGHSAEPQLWWEAMLEPYMEEIEAREEEAREAQAAKAEAALEEERSQQPLQHDAACGDDEVEEEEEEMLLKERMRQEERKEQREREQAEQDGEAQKQK